MSPEPLKVVVPTAETAQSDAGTVEDPELPPPEKKRRAARGEAGTFAGTRPPTKSEGKELFECKKVLCTKTQQKYWKHLKKALPNCDCKLSEKTPSKADVRAELKNASEN